MSKRSHLFSNAWLMGVALCAATSIAAQRNEVAVSAVGNFNPVSYIWIQHPQPEVISSNKSSLGASASYQRWWWSNCAIGMLYEQNPSAGKLFDHHYYIRWPQMRYEVAAFSSQRIGPGRTSLFVREGVGNIITNGYKESGWSHDFSILAGFGVDYRFTPHTSFRTGLMVLASKTGCYNDHTCRETWATVDDMSTGIVWRF